MIKIPTKDYNVVALSDRELLLLQNITLSFSMQMKNEGRPKVQVDEVEALHVSLRDF